MSYTDDMLALLDVDLHFLEVNMAYARMFQKQPAEFKGQTIEQLFAHDPNHYRNIIHPILQKCLSGTPHRYEIWIDVPVFGNLFLDLQYEPVRNEADEITGIAIVGRNRTEVMRSIEALKRSETMLNRTEHIANLGGWFFDLNRSEIRWTNEMYNIHEVGRDFTLTQESINEFVPEAYLPEVLQAVEKTIQGHPSSVVSPLITKNGTHKWVRSMAFPVLEDGKVVSIEGILQDITELTNIQQRLHHSEERFRDLVENTNVVTWESGAPPSPPGFHYMSPHAVVMTGYSLTELLEPDFLLKHVHPDDLMPCWNIVTEKTALRQDFFLEYRLFRADGTLIWIHDEIKLIRDESGKPVQLRGVMVDITRMKEMQAGLSKALRAIENHKYILDQHAIVSITDRAGRITYVNEKFIENTGYSRDELVGNSHSLLKSGIHTADFYARLWETVLAGKVWQGEICNLNKRGAYNWVYTTIVPLLDEHGKVEEFMSVRTDITDLRRTEESLRRVQKMEAIGQLTGGIAHDFNNLLGIVIGNLDLIELGMEGNSTELPLVENARNAAMRGSVLTRRLLNFSRQAPTAGRALDLNPIIRNLDVLLSKSLTAMVEIRMELQADPWFVEVDSGDFEDAIINLALNASDAMPTGGKLLFTTRNHTCRQTEHRNNGTLPAGQYVELTVEDDGTGIPRDIIEKIFDPYFTTKASDKGSGLGLAMVYGFVKRSKGQIFVDSALGRGTRFTLYLPKAARSAETKTEEPAQVPAARPRARDDETILLVDDEEDILKITSISLENLGYRVICSTNAEEAIEVLQRGERIDLLFTDVVMPGKYNGFELAETAQTMRPGLPTLLTSGYAKEKSGLGQQRWGSVMMPKPYRGADLARRIRVLLDEKSPPN